MPTNNHGYNTPEAGSTDWNIPLNENFANLDRDVPIIDLESNLSEYEPNANQLFVARDSGTVYVGDGSQWDIVFDGGNISKRSFYHGTSEPSDPSTGDVWFDTSETSSNSEPTASFTVAVSDLTVDVDASDASDSDGSISSYDWTFGDGSSGNGVTTSHTYSSGGDYTITLTITDDDGATDSASQTVSVTDSSGSTSTVIDDFEGADISSYSGDTDPFTVQTDVVQSGSYALACPQKSSNPGITSTSGLNTYPSAGDEFRYRVHSEDHANAGIRLRFGAQGEVRRADGYTVEIDGRGVSTGTGQTLALVKRQNGSDVDLNWTSVSDWSTYDNEWLEVVVQWASDGTITASVYDTAGNLIQDVSASDTDYTSGGVGFFIYPDNAQSKRIYWDNCRITDTGL